MAYPKQTWTDESYITPSAMNHIEDGIASAGVEALVTVNSAGESKTAEWLLNTLYDGISILDNAVVYDGYIEWGGIIFRCSRKNSGTINYMFESIDLNTAVTSMEYSVFKVADSGSKFIRVSINLSTNAVTSTDLSSTTFTSPMYFYGKTINATVISS